MISSQNIFLPPPVRPLDEEPMATGGRQVCTMVLNIEGYACPRNFTVARALSDEEPMAAGGR